MQANFHGRRRRDFEEKELLVGSHETFNFCFSFFVFFNLFSFSFSSPPQSCEKPSRWWFCLLKKLREKDKPKEKNLKLVFHFLYFGFSTVFSILPLANFVMTMLAFVFLLIGMKPKGLFSF